MKYHWLVLGFICVMFTSCNDTVEFNTPAFQAYTGGNLWKSDTQEAVTASDIYKVTGKVNGHTMNLEFPMAFPDTIQLGPGQAPSKATFISAQGETFSTLFSAVDSLNTSVNESVIYPSEGEIIIDKENTTSAYISGEFWFTAYDTLGVDKVDFYQGVFYEVPIN